MDEGDLWALYRTGLAVLREGSLSGAGRALGLSQPTVGRHIEALERKLGHGPLFTRSQKGLLPTGAALAMRPHLEAMAAAAEAALRAGSATPDALSGTVRIAASEIVGGEVLPGLLAPVRDAHPGLAFELSLSNLTEDLLRRDADIAVRMVKPQQTALLARQIGMVKVGLYAHEAYLRRHGMPETIKDLSDHAVIGFDRVTPFLDLAARHLSVDRAMFALRTDNDLATLAALRAGFGLGVCHLPIAARDPALHAVLPHLIGFDLPIWVVMHEDLKQVRRVRVVFEALVEGLLRYVGEVSPAQGPRPGAQDELRR